MPLNLPAGKRLAVCLGPDFDAQSVWMGTFRSTSQSHMSRGEFDALVGAPRLLDTLQRYGITTTWFVPTHTMRTFPDAVTRVIDAGHEIAAHGVYHEYIPKLDIVEERRLLDLQIAEHEEIVGVRPLGYRSPSLDVTDSTVELLGEYGFNWDSSLMGRDFEPYHPRMVTEVDRERGNTFGAPAQILEFPVSWYLDDFPELESFASSPLIQSHDVVLSRWKDSFDFAHQRCPGGVMSFAIHPQTVGRAHHILMLERFLDHVSQHDDVWFPTMSELYATWSEPPEHGQVDPDTDETPNGLEV